MAENVEQAVARLRGVLDSLAAAGPVVVHHDSPFAADLYALIAAYADAARDRDKAQVTADLVRRMGGSTVRADDRVPRDELWWLDERGEVAGKVFGLAARTGEAR